MAWAQEMKNLAAGIKVSRKDRAQRIGEIQAQTADILGAAGDYMKRVSAELKEMFKDLKDFLAKSEDVRKKDFAAMMGEVRTTVKNIKGDVKELLAKSEGKRMEEFKTLMADIRGRVRGIKKDTAEMIGSYGAERREAADYWARLGGREAAVEETGEEVSAPKKRGRKKE